MGAVALQSFGFGEQLVRVVERDGGVWFVAKDVCAVLEISNHNDAVSRLEDDEKGVGTTDPLGPGGAQEITIISESGLYALIFRSRKPIAVKFRKWVTGEVLPAIRKTGRYEARPANDRTFDLSGALGTEDDKHTIKTALLTVQMYKDLWGQAAGREMAKKLGFPEPGVHMGGANPAAAAGFAQVEGDLHQWAQAAGLKQSRRDATHISELYDSYVRWCGATGASPMHPTKFKDAMVLLFNHEEHPEMIRVVLCRR